MLTLSRRIGESLMIDDDIEVIVQDINRGHVRISIRAPDEVTILRKELYELDRLEDGVDEAI